MAIVTAVVFEDDTLQIIHEDDAENGYHGERVEYKPGTPQRNAADLVAALADPALIARLTAIRGRALDIREGYGVSAPTGTNPITGQPYAAITGTNQQARAVRDLADAQNDMARHLINAIGRLTDSTAPPAT